MSLRNAANIPSNIPTRQGGMTSVGGRPALGDLMGTLQRPGSPGGERMLKPLADSIEDAVLAFGNRPLLRLADQRMLGGPFFVDGAITDNAAFEVNLTLGSLWDQRVQGLYTSAATQIEAILHLDGFAIYANDGVFSAETNAIKYALEQALYLRTKREGFLVDYPVVGRIIEPYLTRQVTQGTAAAGDHTIMQGLRGGSYLLDRPIRIDLKTEQLALKCDSAINYAGTGMVVQVVLLGVLVPRETAGTEYSDVTCSTSPVGSNPGGAPIAVGPVEFAGLSPVGLVGSRSASILGL